MKSFIILSISFFLMSSDVIADNYFGSDTGTCTFAYDKNNHVSFPNCESALNVYESVPGQGFAANGSSAVVYKYKLLNYTYPRLAGSFLKGDGASGSMYPDSKYKTISGSFCHMTDDVATYKTNDWNMELNYGQYDYKTDIMPIYYVINCRGGVP